MNKTQVNFNIAKKYIKYLWPYLGLEIGILLLVLAASAGALVTPYVLKIIIDDVFPKGTYKDLVVILAFLVFVYVLRILCNLFSEILYAKVSQKIISDIRSDLLVKILNKPQSFYRSQKSGDILFSVMNDVQNIQTALTSLVLGFISDSATIIGIILMLGILSLKLTLISLVIIPCILFSIKNFTPFIHLTFQRIQEQQEIINNFFLERIKNIRVIKSYSTLQFEFNKLKGIHHNLITVYIKNAIVTALNNNITTFFVAIGPIIVLMYGGRAIFSGTLTIGAIIAFMQYLNRLHSPTVAIMNNYSNFTRALVSMERLERHFPIEFQVPTISEKQPFTFNQVIFDNVDYRIDNKCILSNLNLQFERGKIYAIIGPSGSGKSSILNLLCKFDIPTCGAISIDSGTCIGKLENWTDVLGLIEKDNQLFSGTIYENITYGLNNITKDQIETILSHSKLEDVVNGLSIGITTGTNESGGFLSDGQKQRISIARALLRNPSILIFDESTSALDLKLEQEIIKNLKSFYSNAIIIIVTHRSNNLKEYDYIYAIEGGFLVKEGGPRSFTDIVSNHPENARLTAS